MVDCSISLFVPPGARVLEVPGGATREEEEASIPRRRTAVIVWDGTRKAAMARIGNVRFGGW